MKTTLLMAAVLVMAACGGERQADTPMVDTTSAVEPMMQDTTMMPDTGMMHPDSMMARDSM